MKLLLTSDIHGNSTALNKIKEDFDYHLDAGDSLIPEHILSIQNITSVRGNCDYYSKLPLERIYEFDNKRFLVVHGHLHDVKYGLNKLITYAQSKGVSYCIYGHTHIQSMTKVGDITFINPGSINNKPIEYAIYQDGIITLKKV